MIKIKRVFWLMPLLRPCGTSIPISSYQTLQELGSLLNDEQIASNALSGVRRPRKVLEFIIKLGYVLCPKFYQSIANYLRRTFSEVARLFLSSKVYSTHSLTGSYGSSSAFRASFEHSSVILFLQSSWASATYLKKRTR